MATLSTAAQIDAAISHAIAAGLPRLAVLVGRSSSPGPVYESFNGLHKLASGECAEGTPLTRSSVFHMASCTKLVTVVAALQLVERGQVGLDDDLREVLPALKEVGILKGWNGQEPVVEPTPKVTLRELITHTSGFTYNDTEDHEKYRVQQGISLVWETESTIEGVTKIPLMFEPGTRFKYGMSNDWLGFVVAHLSGLTLEQYFQKNIFGPLGISDISFVLPNPQKIDQCLGPSEKHPNTYRKHPGQVLSQDYQLGGAGLSGSPASYLVLLQSLLAGANSSTPSPLLRGDTIRSMFVDQLSNEAMRDDLAAQTWDGSPWGRALGESAWRSQINPGWGLGGALTGADLPSGRAKGSLFWSGFANTFWVIDRERDVCFCVWGNSIPHGDQGLFEVWGQVEPLIYQGLEEAREKKAAL